MVIRLTRWVLGRFKSDSDLPLLVRVRLLESTLLRRFWPWRGVTPCCRVGTPVVGLPSSLIVGKNPNHTVCTKSDPSREYETRERRGNGERSPEGGKAEVDATKRKLP